jgi:hypothetical protein
MTYFSVPFQQVQYTIGQFWASFSVVFVLSWAALVGFGVVSGSLQTGWVWRKIVGASKGVVRGVRGG